MSRPFDLLKRPEHVCRVLANYYGHDTTRAAVLYDAWFVAADHQLSASDVFVSVSLSGRARASVYSALVTENRLPEISRRLAAIPAAASISDPGDLLQPGGPVEELLRYVAGIKGIRLPIATKILHKKRPALIPILDSQVIKFYLGADDPVFNESDAPHSTVRLLDVVRRDVVSRHDLLASGAQLFSASSVAKSISPPPPMLSPLRVLDILVWSWMEDQQTYYAQACDREAPVDSSDAPDAAATGSTAQASRAPVCPNCGSSKVVPIFYGYPAADSMEPLLEAVKRGEVALGGCCIDGDEPALSCGDCRHRWGRR